MTRSPETSTKPISVVIVTGPTAAGKTELGIRLAERFGEGARGGKIPYKHCDFLIIPESGPPPDPGICSKSL